jgi:transposase
MSWQNGQAYSDDLRERVLAAVDSGMAVRRVAPIFRVSIAYIYKALARRRATGETSARPQRSHRSRDLAPHHAAIDAKVVAEPDTTLEELRAWMLATHGVSVSVGGMWNTLDRLGLTVKKRLATLPSKSAPTSLKPGKPGASGNPI